MTDIPEDEWRYSINYGPEGEANYAFVYDGGGHLVSNLKIHHAIAVVEQMNARAAQAERMARLEELEPPVMMQLMRDDGNPAWKQIEALFNRNNCEVPGWRVRDVLVSLFVWAQYGKKAARALSQEGSDA